MNENGFWNNTYTTVTNTSPVTSLNGIILLSCRSALDLQYTRLTRWPLWNRYNRVARGRDKIFIWLIIIAAARRRLCVHDPTQCSTQKRYTRNPEWTRRVESSLELRYRDTYRTYNVLYRLSSVIRYIIIIIMLSIQRSIVFHDLTSSVFIIRRSFVPRRSNRNIPTNRSKG